MKWSVRLGLGSILLVVIATIAALTVAAIPVPHGVLGTIYDLDGVTQVPKGIDYSINNTANDFFIQSKTGFGTSGAYAASIAGNNGDEVVITAWNIEHNSTKTVTLESVMRGVDVLLNMTLNPYAPNIISTPLTAAIEDKIYTYYVEAIDYNFDILKYSLLTSPEGMMITESSGKISWTPQGNQVGGSKVILQVSDGNLTTNQSYLVFMENVNDAPNIITTPNKNATVNQLYIYEVNASDDDGNELSFSLVESPKKMSISALGRIEWTPQKKDVGNNTIVLDVSDGNLSASQLWVIDVIDSKPIPAKKTETKRSSASRESRGFVVGNVQSGGRKTVKVKGDSSVKELVIKFKNPVSGASVEISALSQRPAGVKQLSKRVFQYIEIDKFDFNNEDLDEAEIRFAVPKSWLERNKVAPGNIVLTHYSGSDWKEMQTTLDDITGTDVQYTAITNEFSLFAITVQSEIGLDEINDGLQTTPAPVIMEAFSISGFILKSNAKLQVEEGLSYSMTNMRTGDFVKGKTGIGKATGAFVAILPGRIGDVIVMKTMGFEKARGNFTLTGDMDGLTVIIKSDELIFLETEFSNTIDNKLTGYVTAIQSAPKSVMAASMYAFAMLLFIVFRKKLIFKRRVKTHHKLRIRKSKAAKKVKKKHRKGTARRKTSPRRRKL